MAEEGVENLLEYDRLLYKNVQRFKKTKTVEVMMALHTHTGSNDGANDANKTPDQTEIDGAQQVDNQLPAIGNERHRFRINHARHFSISFRGSPISRVEL